MRKTEKLGLNLFDAEDNFDMDKINESTELVEEEVTTILDRPLEDTVYEWLGSHPEIVTALKDGQITYEKLSDALQDLITRISDKTTENKNNIDTLESRMNTFTSLGEGSTTGDAELIDARTILGTLVNLAGTDTGDTAGDAVRRQCGALLYLIDVAYYSAVREIEDTRQEYILPEMTSFITTGKNVFNYNAVQKGRVTEMNPNASKTYEYVGNAVYGEITQDTGYISLISDDTDKYGWIYCKVEPGASYVIKNIEPSCRIYYLKKEAMKCDVFRRIDQNYIYGAVIYTGIYGTEGTFTVPEDYDFVLIAIEISASDKTLESWEKAVICKAEDWDGEYIPFEYKFNAAVGLDNTKITSAVNAYLKAHPVTAGATQEESAQIIQNRDDISNLNGKIKETSEQTAKNKADISALSEKINEDIETINTKINDTYSDLSSEVDANISSINEKIETESEQVTQNKADISELNNAVHEMDAEIKTLEQELAETKKSVSNGKTKIAEALTRLGIKTAIDATFDDIVNNINKMGNGSMAGKFVQSSNIAVGMAGKIKEES